MRITQVASRDLLSAGKLWLPALRALDARAPDRVGEVCARAGLERAALEDLRSRISLSAARRFLREATSVTKEPLFALVAGRDHARESFDVFMRMLLVQPDLETACATAQRFASLPIEGLNVAFEREDQTMRVVMTLQGAPIEDALLAEYVIGVITKLTDETGDPRLRVLEVEVTHAPRAPLAAYRAAIETPFRFQSERTSIVLPHINIPLRDADPMLATLLADLAEATLSSMPSRRSYRDRVEAFLVSRLDDTTLRIEDASEALGMSARTLRRRLEDEASSFAAILDALRRARALELLRDEERSVTDVMTAVGFTSAGAFRRAFNRWTGTSATVYRASITAP